MNNNTFASATRNVVRTNMAVIPRVAIRWNPSVNLSGGGKRAVLVDNQEFSKAITAKVDLQNDGSVLAAT